jgi:hypothetical protein
VNPELAGPPYDPELPILAELEQALHARAAEAVSTAAGARRAAAGGRDPAADRRGAVAPAPARRARGGALRRRGAVVVRRSAVLVSLSLLVGATAVATRSIVAGGGATGDPSLRTTRAVELGAGSAEGERWTLSAARRGGDLCHGLLAGGAVATRCEEPPTPAQLVVDGLATGRARYVVGLTGGRVETVVVTRGETRRAVSTRALSPTAAALRARLPRDLRWFVVALPPTAPTDRPLAATVAGRDRAGRPLGRPVLSCARGARERGCVRLPR